MEARSFAARAAGTLPGPYCPAAQVLSPSATNRPIRVQQMTLVKWLRELLQAVSHRQRLIGIGWSVIRNASSMDAIQLSCYLHSARQAYRYTGPTPKICRSMEHLLSGRAFLPVEVVHETERSESFSGLPTAAEIARRLKMRAARGGR